MSDDSNIINKALNYYDTNTYKYQKFLSKIKYFKIFRAKTDLDKSMITLYDSNKKIILNSRIESLGIYDNTNKSWMWGWAAPIYKSFEINLIRNILNYGLSLNTDRKSYDQLLLKSNLVTSRINISNITQLETNIALASYLAKVPLIFNSSIVDFKKIVDITEKDELNENIFENVKYDYVKDKDFMSSYIFLLDYKNIE